MSATTLLNWEQFLELAETAGKQELLDGELISLPPAKVNQKEIEQQIFHSLESILHRRRVWMETDIACVAAGCNRM
jgi:Uma2 family endonuclease